MTTATNQSHIDLEITSSVARITLRNPPLNVITIPMMEELASALSEIEGRSEISTIVIQGHGKCFSAGVDVGAHTPDLVRAMLEKFHAVIRALVASSTGEVGGAPPMLGSQAPPPSATA
jgi:enoyl-CoA hydratase/carnithine racemase